MLIAQITDFHVLPRGEKMAGVLDTNGMLEAAVSHLNGLEPRPDVVLGTGDLTENGSEGAYRSLREILDGLELPYLLIPGNHDSRERLVAAFSDHRYLPRSGFMHYVVDDYPVRLVALDTTIPGKDEGLLCAERLAWLDATLGASRERPTLIFLHHPPFETGIWWMDSMGLSGSGAFREIVERHAQVKRVVCGHLHRPIQVGWSGAIVSVAPSTCYQIHLDLTPESPPRAVMEPPACLLHQWTGEVFVSHTSYVEWPQQPIDISDAMGDWDAVLAEMRERKRAIDVTRSPRCERRS
jgi:3',5'-cyclic AMP phosphodiesterase CpdA